MERHESLRPLSHDHHHALVWARWLQDPGRAGRPEEAFAELRRRFARELAPHFAVEERDLVARIGSADVALAHATRRVCDDHQALRDLLSPASDTEAALAAFGGLLERHVRFEERTWFPALEAALGADVLSALGPRLAARTPMPELPAGAVDYKRTPEFDDRSVPAALMASHRLRPGAWGEIVVTAGRLRYVLEDEDDLAFVLVPGLVGPVAPERPHHVTPDGPVRFFVRFLRP